MVIINFNNCSILNSSKWRHELRYLSASYTRHSFGKLGCSFKRHLISASFIALTGQGFFSNGVKIISEHILLEAS
jgi:hypothetical protein